MYFLDAGLDSLLKFTSVTPLFSPLLTLKVTKEVWYGC
jgi:hypothetical protein